MKEGRARKKILFVGAGGTLASKVIPLLAEKYDIVGIAGKRQELKEYCTDFYSVNLLAEYKTVFQNVFQKHSFDVVIWNPVRYFFTPLIGTSRESLHTEFDLAVALPVECVRALLPFSTKNTIFIIISSLSAFSHSKNLASYGIIKNAQIKLVEMFTVELADRMFFKAIAPGSVPKIPTENLVENFISAIENDEPSKTLYRVPAVS